MALTAKKVYALLSRKIKEIQASGGGTTNYRDLTNKPQINGIELNGNVSMDTLRAASSTGDFVFDSDGNMADTD